MASDARRPRTALLLVAVAAAPVLAGCLSGAAEDERFAPGAFALARITAYAPPDHANAGQAFVFTPDGVHAVAGDALPSTADAPVVAVHAGSAVPQARPAALGDRPVLPLPFGLVQDLDGGIAGVTFRPTARPAGDLYGEHDAARVVAYPAREDVPREDGAREGDVVELQPYWNANRHMWKSRVVDVRGDVMTVEHLARAGDAFRAGEDRARVVSADAAEIVVDFNHPLAGRALRFNVTLERVLPPVAGAVRLPETTVLLMDGTERTVPVPGEPTLLYFFATWCSVCKEQTPHVREFSERADSARTIVLTTDPTETAADLDAHRARYERAGDEAPWEWAHDPPGETVRRLTITTIPRTILVDHEGRVLLDETGVVPADELLQALDNRGGTTT